MPDRSTEPHKRKLAEIYLQSMSYPRDESWSNCGVFILGCADKGRITVASQQNRATSLVNALHCCEKLKSQGKNRTRIGIIGAGVAGVTAAMLAAKKGAIVDVFDKKAQPVTMFKYATHRHIHPNLFNWPRKGWANEESHEAVYPSWKFARADDVAEKFFLAFQESLRTFDNLRFNENGNEEKQLDLSSGSPRIVSMERGDGDSYDFVFVCTGFGREEYRPDRFENPYWHPDDFYSDNDKLRKYTVVGTGDGGLVDVLRLRIGLGQPAFEQYLVGLLREWKSTEPREYDAAVAKIRSLEGELPKEGFNLDEYKDVPANWLINRIKNHECRIDTDVTLIARNKSAEANQGPERRSFSGFQSPLNRLFFSILVRMKDRLLHIKIGEFSDDGNAWRIVGKGVRKFEGGSERPVLRINTMSSPLDSCIPDVVGNKSSIESNSRFDLHVEPFIYPELVLTPGNAAVDDATDDDIPSRPKFSSDTGIDLQGTPEVTRKNPYLLGGNFVGREKEKVHLTDFLKDQTGERKLLCVTDFGGGGKSALVWDWLTSMETQTLRKEIGLKEYWTSFYARGYCWEGFFLDLADLLNARMPRDTTRSVDWQGTADEILYKLKHGEDEWLLVLDGFEREMDEYASEANFGADSEQLDTRKETANRPDSRIRNEILRRFVVALLDTNAKVLISSRLFPESLIGAKSTEEYSLESVSLSYSNAETIWKNSKGLWIEPTNFIKFLELVAYHPQTIAVVAAAVGASKDSNSSFEDWLDTKAENSEVELALCYDKNLGVTARRHRWLELATADLQSKLKHWILLCRVTSRTDASSVPELESALTSGKDSLLRDREEVVELLNDLKERQVVGFDESSESIDVHPVIRTVVYSHVSRIKRSETKKDKELWGQMKEHLEEQELLTKELSALPPRERLERKDDLALLDAGTRLELLRDFYPNGHQTQPWSMALPSLQLRKDQASVELRAGAALSEFGEVSSASNLFTRARLLFELLGDNDGLEECVSFESWNELYGGSLFQCEREYLRRARRVEATPRDLLRLALAMSIRGHSLAKPLLKRLGKQGDRWFLQTTSEAYLYLGLSRTSRNLAQNGIGLRNENVRPNQELWELVTLGWAYLRLNQPEDAYPLLNTVKKGSESTYYRVVRLFALAGLAECGVQRAANIEHSARKRDLVGLAFQEYMKFEKLDPINKDNTSNGGLHRYSIPAAEIMLSVAKARFAIDEKEDAYRNAANALLQAYGNDDGFSYSAGVQRAKRFLNEHFEGRDLPEKPKSRRELRNYEKSLAKFVRNYLENK